ncbi:MAG: hypothetical protein M1816_007341 [Peltula sp. TS41687]|nr:MAG: hypothetical protein M1816_007341 [Peltula sp. TS41687]
MPLQMDVHLHSRVSALEAQLEWAISEKTSIEQFVKIVLQRLKASSLGNASATEEVTKLRTTVKTLRQQNNGLRAKLLEAHASQENIIKTFSSILNRQAFRTTEHGKHNDTSIIPGQALRSCQRGGISAQALSGTVRDAGRLASTTFADSSGRDTSTDSEEDLVDLLDEFPKSGEQVGNENAADTIGGTINSSPLVSSTSVPAENGDTDLIELEDAGSKIIRPENNVIPGEDRPLVQWPLRKFNAGAYRYASASLSILPDFYKYGIRYMPAEGTPNVFRTVMITNLPPNISMSDLLSRVRGGPLISATILDSHSIIGSMSARIVFFHESSATRYVEFHQQRGLDFSGQVAQVAKLATATWPLQEALRKAIQCHSYTRCLLIEEFPRWISMHVLRSDLGIQSHPSNPRCPIEYVDFDDSGALHLRFTSISAAVEAYEILSCLKQSDRYEQVKISFLPDPCAAPLMPTESGSEIE